jgi:DNA polymerase-3 subunit chi
MKTSKKSTVIQFIRVATNHIKLTKLCETIQRHFDLGQSIMVATPGEEVSNYIDQLLWRLPEESFLPHVCANQPVKERIVITTSQKNLNEASILMNLCPQIASFPNEFELIYELFDETQPAKTEIASGRLESYKQQGYEVKLS